VSRVAKGLSCRTSEEAEALALRITADDSKPDELVVQHHGRLVKAKDPDLTGAARVYLYKVWEASPAIKSASHQATGGCPIPQRAFTNDKRADTAVEGRCSLVSCMWTTITTMMMTDHAGAIGHTASVGVPTCIVLPSSITSLCRDDWAKGQTGPQNHCDILYWCGRGGDSL
jgi:hypothetical protein